MKYEELSEAAKERARDWWREIDTDWWDGEYDYFNEVLNAIGFLDFKVIGFDVDRGSYVQWEGDYAFRYKKEGFKLEDIPAPLHDVVKLLDAQHTLVKMVDPKECLYVNVTPTLRTSIDVDIEPWEGMEGYEEFEGVVDYHSIYEAMDDISDWMLKCLRDQYDWICSDEYAEECLVANDYDFDEDGRRV